MSEHRVQVDNGKYIFHHAGGWRIHVLRHGEPWIDDLDAPKAVASMMAELDAARVVVQAVRDLVNAHDMLRAIVGGSDGVSTLRDALKRHAALVDDHEPPSEWAKP